MLIIIVCCVTLLLVNCEEATLGIIKPDAFENREKILRIIQNNGFQIRYKKIEHLSMKKAEYFYEEHKGKHFYEKLINYMTSGNILTVILEKKNAVADFRKLIGPTNSQEAIKSHPNSIRAKFGTDSTFNAIHGSDSPSSYRRESSILVPSGGNFKYVVLWILIVCALIYVFVKYFSKRS